VCASLPFCASRWLRHSISLPNSSGWPSPPRFERWGCRCLRCEERTSAAAAHLVRTLPRHPARRRLRCGGPSTSCSSSVGRPRSADVGGAHQRFGGRGVNWVPRTTPTSVRLSTRLAPAYDCFFTHDARLARTARRVPCPLSRVRCDPEYFAAPRPPSQDRSGRRRSLFGDLGDVGARARLVAALAGCASSRDRPGWPRGRCTRQTL